MKMIGFVIVTVLAFRSSCFAQVLMAAGATLPYPVYSRWFQDFARVNHETSVNYESIGSGAGIEQLRAGIIDFGASDMPLTDRQMSGLKFQVLHFPSVIGGVVPIYNTGNAGDRLKFTSEILADIFLGKLTRWNDPRLLEINPGANLPDEPIRPIHRSDASGTTFVFTDYLSKTVPEWKSRVGSGTSVNWLTGGAEKGSEGVSGRIRRLTGSIGYVELAYALQNGLPYGSVRNAAGVFISANMTSIKAAAIGVEIPDDFRVSITNPRGRDAYPIATFTWLLVPTAIPDPVRRKAIVSLLRWALSTGQTECEAIGYAPLPREVVARERRAIALLH